MSQGLVEEIMSDSENRLEHLQIENDMTNESPGNIEHTGGSEVAEDQPAHGEETIYWRTNMDCSGATEKTRTVILVTKKTQRVILVTLKIHCVIFFLIVTNSKKTQHDGKPDFLCVPEIYSVLKTQHDGKPDFPCVPKIHSVMKTQHDRKPDFPCVP